MSCSSERKGLSRREFLIGLGSIGLAGLVPELKYFLDPYPREIRDLDRNALIIAGGTTDRDNYFAFFVDALLWYQMATSVLAIPADNVTLLYYDGVMPSNQSLIAQAQTREEEAALESFLSDFSPERVTIDGPADRDAILSQLSASASSAAFRDQTLIFRSGHGFIEVGEDENAHSVMLLPEGGKVSDAEFSEALEGNNSKAVVAFLMQCYATHFLKTPERVANLAVLTADSESGIGERAIRDRREGIQWPWSQAVRKAIIEPEGSDSSKDGRVSLSELQSSILQHDYMAAEGIFDQRRMEFRKTHPGFSSGEELGPDGLSILQYRSVQFELVK